MSSCCSSTPIVRDCCSSASSIEPGITTDPEAFSMLIWRLAVALVLAGQSMVFGLGINMTPPDFGSSVYYIIHGALFLSAILVLVLLGAPLFKESFLALKARRLTLEGLFMLSMLGALTGSLISSITGEGEVYYEVVAIVVVIYTVGKMLGMRSRNKAIDESNKVRQTFDEAYVFDDIGERMLVPLSELNCCSIISVGPGNAVSVDGVIIQGEGYVKETAMTGELEPVSKKTGDLILAGSYSIDGTFQVKPTALKGDRRLDVLLQTVENARLAPSALQAQADAVMQWFLPLVITVAAGTFLFWAGRVHWVNALFNSMSVLLVACPCALGLATPIAIWSGLWKLSSLGLISRSGDFLDTLAQAKRIIFDKTGTLSEESLEISEISILNHFDPDLLNSLIVAAETPIEHPIAKTLSSINCTLISKCNVLTSRLIPGKGISAEIQFNNQIYQILIGERSLMPSWPDTETPAKKNLFVTVNDQPTAIIALNEKFRSGVGETFDELHELGVEGLILTGDSSIQDMTFEGLAMRSGLTPDEKEAIVKDLEDNGHSTIYLGDGVNDASAMSIASASIAMGGGAALTQSTASAILMGDTLQPLPKAITLARKIRKSVKGNMIFAATYNIFGMTLAAMGLLHPVVAALIMLLSSLCVSVRALNAAKSN